MSTTTPVAGTSGTSTTNSATYASGNPNDTLTQADFLQIMVAQFENQDPMADSDGGGSSGTSDYVEELMSMTNITTMQTMSQQQSMQLASSLPGSTVVLNNNGAQVSGVVTGAQIENATLYLTVNGTQYPASDLVSVTQSQAEAIAAAQNSANSSTNSSTSSGTNTSTNSSTTPTGSS
ncbi:MAG TPA: flagellar hook capping FlgD N-terminal domain-containing protein [Candidatus Methylacidiphilales bacterium]|jgi:flagellar basal-body rod modification protein FlgD|nr:flagellar hook capping FlgD N-terminal domain-containing protein [Candidatus Methylacidiphilales bacterium]